MLYGRYNELDRTSEWGFPNILTIDSLGLRDYMNNMTPALKQRCFFQDPMEGNPSDPMEGNPVTDRCFSLWIHGHCLRRYIQKSLQMKNSKLYPLNPLPFRRYGTWIHRVLTIAGICLFQVATNGFRMKIRCK